MNPAYSYQSPSMTPPDVPDYGDRPCAVTRCTEPEIEEYELCEEHLKERADEDRADRMIDDAKYNHREYGQYETDGKGSY